MWTVFMFLIKPCSLTDSMYCNAREINLAKTSWLKYISHKNTFN